MKNFTIVLALTIGGCGALQVPDKQPLPNGAPATFSHHQTFRYIGKKQTFKVPTNVTQIFVVVIGGEGGGTTVAHGGRVSATLPVAQGERLYVRVGGNGTADAGGYNGGGQPGMYGARSFASGGGGASDIRESGDGLSDRIIVAGGGGQGGDDGNWDGRP